MGEHIPEEIVSIFHKDLNIAKVTKSGDASLCVFSKVFEILIIIAFITFLKSTKYYLHPSTFFVNNAQLNI